VLLLIIINLCGWLAGWLLLVGGPVELWSGGMEEGAQAATDVYSYSFSFLFLVDIDICFCLFN